LVTARTTRTTTSCATVAATASARALPVATPWVTHAARLGLGLQGFASEVAIAVETATTTRPARPAIGHVPTAKTTTQGDQVSEL